MSHKILNFPSTTGVLPRFLCPKFVFGRGSVPDPTGGAHDAPPDSLVGWGGGYPLPIPHSPRRLRRLDLGVPNFISRKLATLDTRRRTKRLPVPSLRFSTTFRIAFRFQNTVFHSEFVVLLSERRSCFRIFRSNFRMRFWFRNVVCISE